MDEISIVARTASLIAGLLLLIAYIRYSSFQRLSIWLAIVIASIFFSSTFIGSIYYTTVSTIILLVTWKIRQNRTARERAELAKRLQREAEEHEVRRRRFEEGREAKQRNIAERKEAIAWSPQEREQRERALLETLDRLMDEQIAVLESQFVEVVTLARALGWTEGACIFVADGLGRRDLVELRRVSRFPGYEEIAAVCLTKAGFERLEKMRKPEEAKFSRNLLINSIINVGSGNQQALNSTDTSQRGEFADVAIAQLESLLDEYRKALETEAVDEEVRQLASADISALEVQLARKPLNTSVVKELITSLRTIAEGIAGSAAFSYLASRLGS